MKYRKKPVTIEAVEWTGNNAIEVLAFMGKIDVDFTPCCKMEEDKWHEYCEILREDGIAIDTLEGTMIASVGDFVIKGLKGEFYPCKPDVFDMTYEIVK